jgi:integrase
MSKANPTGHVRVIERKSGPVYYAKIKLPDGREPQRRLGKAWLKRSRPPKGYITPSQADELLQRLLRGEDETLPIASPSGATFAIAAREWLRYVEHDRKREHSTVEGYRRAVEGRLIPEFGTLALEVIDTDRADKWREQLIAEGLSPNTINKLRWKGEAIYKRAARVWGITSNPFALVERQPRSARGEFNTLEPNETLLLATNAAHDQDAALYVVAAFTGLRLGELRALRWRDLDFANRLVYVRRSFTQGKLKDYPKGRSVRSVPMIDHVIPPLDRLSQRAHFVEPDDLVFVNETGSYIEASALRRRFYTALDNSKLKRLRIHDLRHSYCTMAVRAYRVDEVKAYAGHADIATTMLYVHHVPAHDAADRLSAVVAASIDPPSVPRNMPRIAVMPLNRAQLSASNLALESQARE